VTVNNSPYIAPGNIDHDAGIYLQDSWTIKRLTFNPGVRVEYFKVSVSEVSMAAGRFSPARYYPKSQLINWGPTYAPRFSWAYDVFGNGRTALKTSYSKYYRQYDADPFMNYADAGRRTENRNWSDCDFTPGTSLCSALSLPTNGDGIAQDNEIGPSPSPNFGAKAARTAGDLRRQYNWEFTVGGQHQVSPRLAVGAMMYKRRVGDIQISDKSLITPQDYASFTLPMPDFSNDPTLTGVLNPSEVLTVYNLDKSKSGVFSAPILDYSSNSDKSLYTGYEVNFSTRIPGTTLFGSWTAERNRSIFCTNNDDPNGVSTSDLYTGATVSAGGRFCDQTKFAVPFRHEFKLAGNYPVRYGIDIGFVVQSFPGADRVVTWQPAASLFPGNARTNAETIVLTEPGTVFQPRWNQLDMNFKKNFRQGRKVFTVEVEYFNILNANAIWTTNNAIGSSLGQVQTILPGRIPRLAFQMKW